MRRVLIVIVLLAAVLGLVLWLTPAPAHAQTVVADPFSSCEKSVEGKIANNYIYPDNAEELTDKPVIQGGPSLSCGNWSFELWTSTELSSRPYAHRGFGDEGDLTVAYGNTVDSPLGELAVEVNASYWMLYRFSNMNDDTIATYADVGRPISVGMATLTPFVRVTEWWGLKESSDTTLVRGGFRFEIPLGETLNFEGDASRSWVVSPTSFHRDILTANLVKEIGNGWSGSFGTQLIPHAPASFWIGLSKSW